MPHTLLLMQIPYKSCTKWLLARASALGYFAILVHSSAAAAFVVWSPSASPSFILDYHTLRWRSQFASLSPSPRHLLFGILAFIFSLKGTTRKNLPFPFTIFASTTAAAAVFSHRLSLFVLFCFSSFFAEKCEK